MCGLVAYYSAKRNTVNDDEKMERWFRKALLLDVVRGYDSTGVCSVYENGAYEVHKKALASYDFLETSQGKEITSTRSYFVRAMIGHNRAATVGKVNADNAHPFTHGDITLVHNGTLVSETGLVGDFGTDSEAICNTLSLQDTKTVLEKIYGAFALIWYDAGKKTINFARNHERPLFFAPVGTDNSTYVFASEPWIIRGAASEPFRPELKLGKIEPVKEDIWYEVNLETGVVTETTFVSLDSYSYGSNKWGSSYSGNGSVVTTDAGKGSMDACDVKPGDTILFEMTEEQEPLYSTNNTTSVVGKVVTAHKDGTKGIKARTYAIQFAPINDLIRGGVTIFKAKVDRDSISYSDTITVNTVEGVGSREEFEQGAYIEFDAVFKNRVAKDRLPVTVPATVDEEGDVEDDLPFNFYDERGKPLSEREYVRLGNRGCPYCGSPVVLADADDAIHYQDELWHGDCYLKELEAIQQAAGVAH